MNRWERLARSWIKNPPKEGDPKKVRGLLDWLVESTGGRYVRDGDKHNIIVDLPPLQGDPWFGPRGRLALAISHGENQKDFIHTKYMRVLIRALEIMLDPDE